MVLLYTRDYGKFGQLLHTEETNNTGDETESDESEPQPRQAKSRRVIID